MGTKSGDLVLFPMTLLPWRSFPDRLIHLKCGEKQYQYIPAVTGMRTSFPSALLWEIPLLSPPFHPYTCPPHTFPNSCSYWMNKAINSPLHSHLSQAPADADRILTYSIWQCSESERATAAYRPTPTSDQTRFHMTCKYRSANATQKPGPGPPHLESCMCRKHTPGILLHFQLCFLCGGPFFFFSYWIIPLWWLK